MDDTAIAAAIAARLQAVTPPAGQPAIAVATAMLDIPTEFPALLLYPPEEDISWLPGRQMESTSEWTAELYLDAGADLPQRMAAVYAWRTAIRTQLATQIQLGVPGVQSALLTGLGAPELDMDDRAVDGLRLVITLVVREPVPAAAA